MKFKIDENLPSEFAVMLRGAGFDARSKAEEDLTGAADRDIFVQCQAERRAFITLDLDFANVRAYPPGSHFGILVFRSKSQDKITLLAMLERLV